MGPQVLVIVLVLDEFGLAQRSLPSISGSVSPVGRDAAGRNTLSRTRTTTSTRTITDGTLYSIEAGLAGIASFDTYSVGSGIPATIKASLRSTQVPQVPQCIAPPL